MKIFGLIVTIWLQVQGVGYQRIFPNDCADLSKQLSIYFIEFHFSAFGKLW